ncbi:MAG: hypothetical protein ACXVPU_09270 [Bacteroidia bacterium]
MDKSSIRKEIGSLINSIKEHSDNIGDKEHIPQLELELILHKIEKLYQKSIVYNYLHLLPDIKETAKPIEKKEEVAGSLLNETSKTEPVKQESLKTQAEDKTIDLFGSILPPATEKPKQEKEKPKQEKKIEKKEEKPAVNKIQKPVITDITKAIGINDKFRFANELFAGSMQEYSIAIQQLNSAESLEAAMDYFSNLQMLYEWDVENETVKQLLDLVDRRYS